MLKTHLFSRSYSIDYSNCFADYEQRTLYCALLAMLLRLINCRFIIIVLIMDYTLRYVQLA